MDNRRVQISLKNLRFVSLNDKQIIFGYEDGVMLFVEFVTQDEAISEYDQDGKKFIDPENTCVAFYGIRNFGQSFLSPVEDAPEK